MIMTLQCGRCGEITKVPIKKNTPKNRMCKCGSMLIKDGVIAKRK
jgi:hypothetical protein